MTDADRTIIVSPKLDIHITEQSFANPYLNLARMRMHFEVRCPGGNCSAAAETVAVVDAALPAFTADPATSRRLPQRLIFYFGTDNAVLAGEAREGRTLFEIGIDDLRRIAATKQQKMSVFGFMGWIDSERLRQFDSAIAAHTKSKGDE